MRKYRVWLTAALVINLVVFVWVCDELLSDEKK